MSKNSGPKYHLYNEQCIYPFFSNIYRGILCEYEQQKEIKKTLKTRMCYTSKYHKKSHYTKGQNVGILNEGFVVFFVCLSYSEEYDENEWNLEKPEIFS